MSADRITSLPDGRIRHARGSWSSEFTVDQLPSKAALYERLARLCETRERRPDPVAAAAYRATAKALRDVLQMVRNREARTS